MLWGLEFYDFIEACLGVWRTGLVVEDLVGSRGGQPWVGVATVELGL